MTLSCSIPDETSYFAFVYPATQSPESAVHARAQVLEMVQQTYESVDVATAACANSALDLFSNGRTP